MEEAERRRASASGVGKLKCCKLRDSHAKNNIGSRLLYCKICIFNIIPVKSLVCVLHYQYNIILTNTDQCT